MTYISESYSVPRARFYGGLVEKQIHLIVFALDLLALAFAYRISLPLAAALIELFQTSSPESFYAAAKIREVVYFCLALGALFFLFLNGHYTRRVPWWTQIQQISKIMFFALLIDVFASFALELYYSRILIGTNWAAAFGLIVVTRLGVNMIKSRSEKWTLPAAIIADANTATDTLYALASDNGMGLSARAILLRDKAAATIDREEFPANYRDIEVHSAGDSYENYILSHPNQFYIVSIEGLEPGKRDHLINLFHKNGIGFALIPAISRTSVYHAEPHYFFGNDIMLLNARKPVVSPVGKILKRSIDIIGASVALAIFIVPMLLVALFLKLEGQGGTPLYAGKRVGQNGKLFTCWKFRTMEPDTDHLLHEYLAKNPEAKAHWERYFKLPDDPRVQAKTARFIRKASVDELPQLWNVLKGDMSLVGPRPILESEIEAYGDRIDEYTLVKPGITGLWQASGRNGTSFKRRVVWDSWYVRNWTLWGDIVIILKTIQVVLSKSGAS